MGWRGVNRAALLVDIVQKQSLNSDSCEQEINALGSEVASTARAGSRVEAGRASVKSNCGTYKKVLRRLRCRSKRVGYLTIGCLARAIVDLDGSPSHLAELQTFLEDSTFPLLPSRSHAEARNLPLWTIEMALQHFGHLVRGQPSEELIVHCFGYGGLALSDDTRSFLAQVWLCHCLSRAEEKAHAAIVCAEVDAAGDDIATWSPRALEAREALILDNLWLVVRTARKFIRDGTVIDDLLQIGSIALVRAIPNFDPLYDVRFATYASRGIWQSIKRYVDTANRTIRLPFHLLDVEAKVNETRDLLRNTLPQEPTVDQIAKAAGIATDIVRAHLIISRPVSLDDLQWRPILERMPALTDDPAVLSQRSDLQMRASTALASLSLSEQQVIEARHGLVDGNARTLEEVGRDFGVTRERIRQIEAKALQKLRHPTRARYLKAFATPEVPGHLSAVQSRDPAWPTRPLVRGLRDSTNELERSLASRGNAQIDSRPIKKGPGAIAAEGSRTNSKSNSGSAAQALSDRPRNSNSRADARAKPDARYRPAPVAKSPEDRFAKLEATAKNRDRDQANSHADLRQFDAHCPVIERAARSISDPMLRAVAESRIGREDRRGLTRSQAMLKFGVSRAFVRYAERALCNRIVDPSVLQAISACLDRDGESEP